MGSSLIRAAIVALVLAACAAAPEAAVNLNGTSWREASGGEHAPTIAFADGRASGHAGCNRWFAGVTHGEGVAMTFGDAGLTRMMCEPARMEVERRFMAAIRETQIAVVQDDTLILRDIGGADVARFTRVGSAP
ncbi:MAG: META domain-containing protein [Hyphomonadaceae bacterium JAD_PAG50586_4]|nr:MAG: META domain-containing protein [Hyphomonadaceae bacterium JAD_PAG50586_4]